MAKETKVEETKAAPEKKPGKYDGKMIVRAEKYRDGSNPRKEGSHGFNLFALVPADAKGITADALKKAGKEAGVAGFMNHVKWDLEHGYLELVDA